MNEQLTVLEVSQQAIERSLVDLWERFIGFLPILLGAVVVFVIGWIIAVAVDNLVERLLRTLKVNEAFDRISGLRAAMQRAGMDLNVAGFVGGIVKWFLLIVALLAASDILGLAGVSLFLNRVIAYLPNIVVASLIVVMGVVFGNFVQRVAKGSLEAARLPHGQMAAVVAKWAIYVFTFFATMLQLQIAEGLIQPLFIAFAAMIAIAGGLAFGLGGKDLGEKILRHLEKDLTDRT